MTRNTRSLKVLEDYTRDVGKGIARIDYDSMDSLGASTGDIIEIKGKRRTVAKCLPLDPSDAGKGIVRIDRLIRHNAKIRIGQYVLVKQVTLNDAQSMKVFSTKKITLDSEQYDYAQDDVKGRPIMMGDKIELSFFDEKSEFEVRRINPSPAAVMTAKTKIIFLNTK